jgi:hypothetical protein
LVWSFLGPDIGVCDVSRRLVPGMSMLMRAMAGSR